MMTLVLIIALSQSSTGFTTIVVPNLKDEDRCISLGRNITNSLQNINSQVSTTIYCEGE